MRVELDFQLEKSEISLEYRKAVISFIKSALTKCNDAKYFENYYKDTIQKNFTWLAIFPKPRFTKERIELSENRFRLIFSVEDQERSAYILYMALNGMKYKKFPLENTNAMTLLGIRQLPQKMIVGSSCIFRTSIGSPLVIRDHNSKTNHDKYYSVEDSEFNEKLTESIIRQLVNDGYDDALQSMIQAKIIRGKKVVVRHYGQLLDTTAGLIEISAPNYMLQHLYQVGLCSRRSAGFGALELIAEREV